MYDLYTSHTEHYRDNNTKKKQKRKHSHIIDINIFSDVVNFLKFQSWSLAGHYICRMLIVLVLSPPRRVAVAKVKNRPGDSVCGHQQQQNVAHISIPNEKWLAEGLTFFWFFGRDWSLFLRILYLASCLVLSQNVHMFFIGIKNIFFIGRDSCALHWSARAGHTLNCVVFGIFGVRDSGWHCCSQMMVIRWHVGELDAQAKREQRDNRAAHAKTTN